MSEIMLGVLEMPDEMFWDDNPIARLQHNSIRKEAAAEIRKLRAELAKHSALPDGQNNKGERQCKE